MHYKLQLGENRDALIATYKINSTGEADAENFKKPFLIIFFVLDGCCRGWKQSNGPSEDFFDMQEVLKK